MPRLFCILFVLFISSNVKVHAHRTPSRHRLLDCEDKILIPPPICTNLRSFFQQRGLSDELGKLKIDKRMGEELSNKIVGMKGQLILNDKDYRNCWGSFSGIIEMVNSFK